MTAPITNTPLLDRIDARREMPAPVVDRRPRWKRIQDEAIAERERRGGSRFDAVADTTRSVVAL